MEFEQLVEKPGSSILEGEKPTSYNQPTRQPKASTVADDEGFGAAEDPRSLCSWRKDIDSAEFGGTVAFKMIQHTPSSSTVPFYILEPKKYMSDLPRMPGYQDAK